MPAQITYVSGHKNPDTDSCCSAICYSRFLKACHPKRNIIPMTAGPIMEQTRFILNKFGVTPPDVISDISPKAKHVPQTGRDVLNINQPVSQALEIYNQKQQLDFACIDDENNYIGMLQINDLITSILRPVNETDMTQISCTINSLIKTLGAQIVHNTQNLNEINKYRLVIPTMDLEGFKLISDSWDVERWSESLFIMGYNPEITSYIIKNNGGMIILTRSAEQITRIKAMQKTHQPMNRVSSHQAINEMVHHEMEGPEGTSVILQHIQTHNETDPLYNIIKEAPEHTTIMCTSFCVAAATVLSKQATPVKLLCKSDKVHQVKDNTPLRDIKERFLAHKQVHALAVVDQQGKYLNLLKRFDIEDVNLIDLVLVDHNELGQQPTGSQAIGVSIIEIVDHHKIAIDDQQKVQKMTVKPVGCTCTIIFELFKQKGVQLDKQTASLLMSAILTDTLILKSPTATKTDAETLKLLQDLTGIDYLQLGAEIFSSVQGFSSMDKKKVVKQDYKVFEAKQGRYGVSQVEVSSHSQISDDVINELLQILKEMSTNEGLFLTCCLVTDVQLNSSILITNGPASFADVVGYGLWKNKKCCYDLPGVVSRKKQLMPHLINVLSLLE
ncbi:Inorganic_diphosphatase [Hexamita inflata]|uniref:inorganic diphosphatase n=1 Tax=Hexamita inflata TaxID=28002 RepID=A0AA86P1P7_9EUKA|nr:Inorganic diphosphatase [Hexamita inflata]